MWSEVYKELSKEGKEKVSKREGLDEETLIKRARYCWDKLEKYCNCPACGGYND
jgi:hypothetical protein